MKQTPAYSSHVSSLESGTLRCLPLIQTQQLLKKDFPDLLMSDPQKRLDTIERLKIEITSTTTLYPPHHASSMVAMHECSEAFLLEFLDTIGAMPDTMEDKIKMLDYTQMCSSHLERAANIYGGMTHGATQTHMTQTYGTIPAIPAPMVSPRGFLSSSPYTAYPIQQPYTAYPIPSAISQPQAPYYSPAPQLSNPHPTHATPIASSTTPVRPSVLRPSPLSSQLHRLVQKSQSQSASPQNSKTISDTDVGLHMYSTILEALQESCASESAFLIRTLHEQLTAFCQRLPNCNPESIRKHAKMTTSTGPRQRYWRFDATLTRQAYEVFETPLKECMQLSLEQAIDNEQTASHKAYISENKLRTAIVNGCQTYYIKHCVSTPLEEPAIPIPTFEEQTDAVIADPNPPVSAFHATSSSSHKGIVPSTSPLATRTATTMIADSPLSTLSNVTPPQQGSLDSGTLSTSYPSHSAHATYVMSPIAASTTLVRPSFPRPSPLSLQLKRLLQKSAPQTALPQTALPRNPKTTSRADLDQYMHRAILETLQKSCASESASWIRTLHEPLTAFCKRLPNCKPQTLCKGEPRRKLQNTSTSSTGPRQRYWRFDATLTRQAYEVFETPLKEIMQLSLENAISTNTLRSKKDFISEKVLCAAIAIGFLSYYHEHRLSTPLEEPTIPIPTFEEQTDPVIADPNPRVPAFHTTSSRQTHNSIVTTISPLETHAAITLTASSASSSTLPDIALPEQSSHARLGLSTSSSTSHSDGSSIENHPQGLQHRVSAPMHALGLPPSPQPLSASIRYMKTLRSRIENNLNIDPHSEKLHIQDLHKQLETFIDLLSRSQGTQYFKLSQVANAINQGFTAPLKSDITSTLATLRQKKNLISMDVSIDQIATSIVVACHNYLATEHGLNTINLSNMTKRMEQFIQVLDLVDVSNTSAFHATSPVPHNGTECSSPLRINSAASTLLALSHVTSPPQGPLDSSNNTPSSPQSVSPLIQVRMGCINALTSRIRKSLNTDPHSGKLHIQDLHKQLKTFIDLLSRRHRTQYFTLSQVTQAINQGFKEPLKTDITCTFETLRQKNNLTSSGISIDQIATSIVVACHNYLATEHGLNTINLSNMNKRMKQFIQVLDLVDVSNISAFHETSPVPHNASPLLINSAASALLDLSYLTPPQQGSLGSSNDIPASPQSLSPTPSSTDTEDIEQMNPSKRVRMDSPIPDSPRPCLVIDESYVGPEPIQHSTPNSGATASWRATVLQRRSQSPELPHSYASASPSRW